MTENKETHQSDVSEGPNEPKERKKLILNAFVLNSPGHLAPGLWKHPRNNSADYTSLKYWTDLAQLLDKANFHALFVADVLGGYDVYKGPANVGPGVPSAAQFPVNDPLYLVPVLAAATKNLVFGITASTTYEQPYQMARRFSTVDHLSGGRVAWNIVTSYLESAARNLGLDTQIEHDERYRIADEYMDVVYKLWEGSWRDDAVKKNRETGQYADPDLIRQIHHKGKYFNVPGPHLCEPSPQRTPFLFQAGTSKAGKAFGSKHAEAIFMSAQLPELVQPAVKIIREQAKENGRDPSHIKIIAGITIIVAETDEAAKAKREELLSYGDREGALALFGGWTGIDLSTYTDDEDFRFVKDYSVRSVVDRWSSTVPGSDNLPWNKSRIAEYLILGGTGAKAIGSPKTVVDELERWVDIGVIDGFNFANVTIPGSFEDIIDFVLPELQRRGLFRTEVEKEGVTTREVFLNSPWLLEDHPGRKFRWAAGEEPPVYSSK
ncbi:Dimethyl-sulfide monooxygenase [Lachnellula willkommii]|uniref:Dimethyl-sulfide monooxygenase n=1 Tax=Lachnellula willkommii TaxID=215461 RepID=A0A559ML50_9HELO|nr:Dimethyl-sulfide monooxygenase [Lachnellula willkommii]